ncbi:MAG: tail fiber domain-containing protein, partial [Synechococcales bacterium]|nr:tail fiber domain-containing protein [Synechococcales bacterium]
TFRKGVQQSDEATALHLDPTAGEIMMVVQPRSIQDESPRQLGSLGLNVETPAALFDITDPQRGHLFFLPDQTFDPTLCLLRPVPVEGERLYAALSVDTDETRLVSNAPQGFAFYPGGTYDQSPSVCEGTEVLLQIRQSATLQRPQVGIGMSNPAARLDVHCPADQTQVQLLPEQEGRAVPAIALLQHPTDAETVYLTAGLGDRVSGWISNAERGFVFRQAVPFETEEPSACEPSVSAANPEPPGHLFLEPGQTHLAIRETGYVGIGTEEPSARLEVTDTQVGSFRLNPDQAANPALSILKLDPAHTFTLGTSATHAVLATDTTGGFLFKALPESACDADATEAQSPDLEAGRTLVNISPAGQGRVGIGCVPRDYELDVRGIVQAIAIYADTNTDRVCNVKPLNRVLQRMQRLRPVTFAWHEESSSPDSNTDEHIGLLADEVELVFDQVVRTASDGTKAIAYDQLVPVLVQAVNELNQQHHADKQRLENLMEQLANRIALLAIGIGIGWAIALLGYWV